MWKDFVATVDGGKLTLILVLILVDFLAGIVVALKNKTFAFNKLANFLNTSVLGMVGGYLLLGLAATVDASFRPAIVWVWGIMDAALLAGIWLKLKKLFPGLPTPGIVGISTTNHGCVSLNTT